MRFLKFSVTTYPNARRDESEDLFCFIFYTAILRNSIRRYYDTEATPYTYERVQRPCKPFASVDVEFVPVPVAARSRA